MTDVKLLDELHANVRRTRITYRGELRGQPMAIKCYLKPAYGFFHWVRAERKGKKIRSAGAPVPPVVFSGWVREKKCFGFGTAFLEGYKPLRSVLRETSDRARQMEILRTLGKTMVDLHGRGIEQPDGNLTNFLLGPEENIQMVDEDDIRIHSGGVPQAVAIRNLANVAARVLMDDMVEALLSSYRTNVSAGRGKLSQDEVNTFWKYVAENRTSLELKRTKKNINAKRNFD